MKASECPVMELLCWEIGAVWKPARMDTGVEVSKKSKVSLGKYIALAFIYILMVLPALKSNFRL